MARAKKNVLNKHVNASPSHQHWKLATFLCLFENGRRADEHVGGTRLKSIAYIIGEHRQRREGQRVTALIPERQEVELEKGKWGPRKRELLWNIFVSKMERTWIPRTRFFARQPRRLLPLSSLRRPAQLRPATARGKAWRCSARLRPQSRRLRGRTASGEREGTAGRPGGIPPGLWRQRSAGQWEAGEGDSRSGCRPAGFLNSTLGNAL